MLYYLYYLYDYHQRPTQHSAKWQTSLTFSTQVSLSLSKMDKFGNMLHQTLTVFSQLLEIASLQEIGKCTEEILEYLKSIVVASPVATVEVVHQVLHISM